MRRGRRAGRRRRGGSADCLLERPNLLGLMENGLGGTNTIVYRPSTAYDNSGGDAQPDLPFINWVVDKTRRNDGQCTPPLGAASA